MRPALRVISPGLSTTIQDLGRPGHQHLGIPSGGALDPVSLRAANLLAGNVPDAGALEIAYLGPTLAVEADDVRLSFAGADAAIDILTDESDRGGTRIATMRSIRLHHGEIIRIGALSGAAVLYMAVEGGFEIAPVLGSVSTYARGGFGGFDGRALAAGDRLPLVRNGASARQECRLRGFPPKPPRRFRVIAGPQRDYFSDRDMTRFLASEYTVDAGTDRMGMRLRGARIEHQRGFNITSDAIALGSIQVPGDGQPIVLLADRQTTGGYPKIATVISADLPAIGRTAIGSRIGFEQVGLEAAQDARRVLMTEIERLAGRIEPLAPAPIDLAPKLLACNLISGVADAHGN